MAKSVVGIVGSYRRGGVVDATVAAVLERARELGAETSVIALRDRHIEFCKNCRECCQRPGPERGKCVVEDDVDEILSTLEAADAVVLGAPVNFGDVNALTRAFLERMVGYGYWPWGSRGGPKIRKPVSKKAVLVTSSAAPALLTRLFQRSLRTLGAMARLLGARPVAEIVVGRVGTRDFRLPARIRRAARRGAERLA